MSDITEANELVAEISQIRTKAEEQLKAAELARKQADSEGLFAVNAKRACEEHSTAISQLKGVAESEAKTISVNKQKTDEVIAAVNVAKAALDADVKSASDARKNIDQLVGVITANSQTSTSDAKTIVSLKSDAEISLAAVNETFAEIKKAQICTETAKKEIQTIEDAVKRTHEKTTTLMDDISALLTSAQDKEAALEKVLDHLSTSDAAAVQYEQTLDRLKTSFGDLVERVERILPGAASASLASSFNDQKKRFKKPQVGWLIVFIFCIGCLVVVSLPSFLATFGIKFPGYIPSQTALEVFQGLLLRLPIIAPLVWLAIYAGRYYTLSLRLEEEYAYKEAVSRAFEGYKRELENVSVGDAENPAPLNKLCDNVLAAIAERPGRIYESRTKDITILSEAHAAANGAVDLSKKQVSQE